MKRYLVCGLLFSAAVATWEHAGPARGQADPKPTDAVPAAAPVNAPETVVRMYDVRDLIKPVKDYALTGGPLPLTRLGEPTPVPQQVQQQQPQNGPSLPMPMDAAQREAAEISTRGFTLQKLIVDTVDKTSWHDNGGTLGSITPFYGQFVVTQTVDNHKGIEKLLDDLRASRGRSIRVRADWVLLTEGQVEKLQKNPADDKSALPEIERDLLRALPGSTVHYSGSILCLNGQTVSIASGRAKSLVTSLNPVPGYEVATSSPVVSYIQEGIDLQVTATVVGESATLDLASIVTEPNKIIPHPTTQPTIDRLDSDLQHFHTTVQMPVNQAVVVAASTADPNPQDAGGKKLYLIIEADIAK